MFSQSLRAQLLRWFIALLLAIALVHNWTGLQQAMAQNATDAGCHSGDGGSHRSDAVKLYGPIKSSPAQHDHHHHHHH
ncbi:hypothetical protein [Ferrimonas senticii]|uniref:hypothetical protein n=1 Tax=Ferrimonas senticii TaxID=394566 RepID=UPI0003F785EA|nr:hypothetical protein [Ferrimonas senticii]